MMTPVETLLSQKAKTITEKATTVEINLLHPTWLQKMRKQTSVKFMLSPVTLGTLIKISDEFIPVKVELGAKLNWVALSQQLMDNHSHRLAQIIALCIVNSKQDPPENLVDFIHQNTTVEQTVNIVTQIFNHVNTDQFRQFYSLHESKKSPTDQTSGQDSLWRTIGSACKHFGFDYHFILYEISYANFTMLLSTIPVYKSPDDTSKEKKREIDENGYEIAETAEEFFGLPPGKQNSIKEINSAEDFEKLNIK